MGSVPYNKMHRLMQAIILIALLFLFLYVEVPPGAADPAGSEEMSCPESCDDSRKNCELSCSQIVGGGVESGKKRECLQACGDEEVKCGERCLNPTPPPTLEPEPYSDKSCAGACEFRSRDCSEACTRHIGGGAASVERVNCEKACGDELDKCSGMCVNPAAPPTFDPEVFENNPCAGTCASKLEECEGTCGMFAGDGVGGGKRGECLGACKAVQYDCLNSCPR